MSSPIAPSTSASATATAEDHRAHWRSLAAAVLASVSQSSIRLAALRAEECERDPKLGPPLLRDTFARALAGKHRPVDAPFIFRQVREEAKSMQAAYRAPSDASATSPDTTIASVGASAASPSAAATPDLTSVRESLSRRAQEMNSARLAAPDTLIRARYIEDIIEEFCSSKEGMDQLVMLGAGLDSRAYRLSCLSQTDMFELDVDGVLEYKSAVFSALGSDAPCKARNLTRVAVDLGVMGDTPKVSRTSQRASKKAKQREGADAASALGGARDDGPLVSSALAGSAAPAGCPPWLTALLAAGFNPFLRTLWVAEGVLMYLGPKQVGNILGWIAFVANSASAPAAPSSQGTKHFLIADVANSNMVRSKLKWYRFFRWGSDRTTEAAEEHSSRKATLAVATSLLSSPRKLSPIELFMRINGWRVSPCTSPPSGYACSCPNLVERSSTNDAAAAAGSLSSADSVLAVSGAPMLHLHPICRDGLSYSRYLAVPDFDSTTDPKHPPRLLETYMMRAEAVPFEDD
jgi:O-methyltransferase involved in polyketide biosynthesis